MLYSRLHTFVITNQYRGNFPKLPSGYYRTIFLETILFSLFQEEWIRCILKTWNKKKGKINFDIFHVSIRLFFFFFYRSRFQFVKDTMHFMSTESKNERDELISACPPFPPILAFIFLISINGKQYDSTKKKGKKRRRKISKNDNWRYKLNGFRERGEKGV